MKERTAAEQRHAIEVFKRRRARDLFHASWYIRCWRCDKFSVGPWYSKTDAEMAMADIGCGRTGSRCPALRTDSAPDCSCADQCGEPAADPATGLAAWHFGVYATPEGSWRMTDAGTWEPIR